MSTTHPSTTAENTQDAGLAPSAMSPPTRQTRQARQTRRIAVGAIAAVVAALAVMVGVLAPGSTPDAAAEVEAAAASIGSADRFRVNIETDGATFIPGGRAEGAVSGDRLVMTATGIEFRRVDGIDWTRIGEEWFSEPTADDIDPFGTTSAAVIAAALESNQVTNIGEEDLDGITTAHYRIELDDASRDALRAVPPSSQFWFVGDTEELAEEIDGNETMVTRIGFLEDADVIDVWVANGLVHQLSVVNGGQSYTYTFFDFGAPITIEAPE